jgi:hypothetical protein
VCGSSHSICRVTLSQFGQHDREFVTKSGVSSCVFVGVCVGGGGLAGVRRLTRRRFVGGGGPGEQERSPTGRPVII